MSGSDILTDSTKENSWSSPFRSVANKTSISKVTGKLKSRFNKVENAVEEKVAEHQAAEDEAEVDVEEEEEAKAASITPEEDAAIPDEEAEAELASAKEEVEANGGEAKEPVALEDLNPIALGALTEAKTNLIMDKASEAPIKVKLVPLSAADPNIKKLSSTPKMLGRYKDNLSIARASMNKNKVENRDRLVGVGGGKALTEDELYAIARQRVQPLLADVDAQVAKRQQDDKTKLEHERKVYAEKDASKLSVELRKFKKELAKKTAEITKTHQSTVAVLETKKEQSKKDHDEYIQSTKDQMEQDVTDAEEAEKAAAAKHQEDLQKTEENAEQLKKDKTAELEQTKTAQTDAIEAADTFKSNGEALSTKAGEEEAELAEKTSELEALLQKVQAAVEAKYAALSRSKEAKTRTKTYNREITIATSLEKRHHDNVDKLTDHVDTLKHAVSKKEAKLADLQAESEKLVTKRKEATQTRDEWKSSQAKIRAEEAEKQEKIRVEKEEAEKREAIEREESKKKEEELRKEEEEEYEAAQKRAAEKQQRELDEIAAAQAAAKVKKEAELQAIKEQHEAELEATKVKQEAEKEKLAHQKEILRQQKEQEKTMKEQLKQMKKLDKLHGETSTWKKRLSLHGGKKEAAVAGAAVGATIGAGATAIGSTTSATAHTVTSATGIASKAVSGLGKVTARGNTGGASNASKLTPTVTASTITSDPFSDTKGTGAPIEEDAPIMGNPFEGKDVELSSQAPTYDIDDEVHILSNQPTLSPHGTATLSPRGTVGAFTETDSLESAREGTSKPVFTEVVDTQTVQTTGGAASTRTAPSEYDEVISYVPVSQDEYETHKNDPDYFVVRG